MPDSLYTKIINIGSKVDSLSMKVDRLSDKSFFSLWTPIIAALITAIIGTLIAQALDRYFKNRNEKNKELREINSKCFNLKIKLKDLFRQLAMYKFHTQYWWHVYQKQSYSDERNYLEHLRSQSEARGVEKEIGVVKAEFLAEIVKYEKLKGRKFNVDKEKIDIEHLVFIKAKTYNDDISADKLREELAEADETALRDAYFLNLILFQNIIDKMA